MMKNNMKCCHYSNDEFLHNPHAVSSLHVSTHLILITILGGNHYYYLHSKDVKIEVPIS